MSTTPKNIVIIGGGIIGCSSAYYLTRSPSYEPSKTIITLLEASSIAAGASGKAGGLLALDWHGIATSSLAALSYRLHEELAGEHGGVERWGYRALTTVDVVCEAGRKKSGRPKNALEWIDDGVCMMSSILGTTSTTAQVHPERFTKSLAELAQEAGVKIIYGSATKINFSPDDKQSKSCTSVTYTSSPSLTTSSSEITADIIIVAAGPWTSRLLPTIPITATRAHSITIQTSEPVTPYALFTTIRSASGSMSRPEIYARPDEVYVCGEGDDRVPLPNLAQSVEVDEAICSKIFEQVSEISEVLKKGKVDRKQACYLPLHEAGAGPAIGWIQGMSGVMIAAGHSCWGICNGPGTGKVVSEMVYGEKVSADVEQLAPIDA